MAYVILSLWHERRRYVPAVCAVAFSALLVALQCGMLLGTFSIVSIPVDNTSADLWVTCPDVVSVDVSLPIPARWRSRLQQPEIERTEMYYQAFGRWRKPTGAAELVIVMGARLQDGSLGAIRQLTPEMRSRLSEPGTVVVDADDLGRLGIRGVGSTAEIEGRRVKVVGLVRGLKGLAGPYVFCSAETARRVLRIPPTHATYLLARCRPGESPADVAERLRTHQDISVFTGPEFSLHSRLHWLLRTGGGLALLAAAVLGLVVGALITNQTLYAAAAASMKENAVLRAMGISRWRIAAAVLAQAFCVGLTGTALGGAAVGPLAMLVRSCGANLLLPGWLLCSSGILTLLMAMVSGMATLRSLRLADPVTLLR